MQREDALRILGEVYEGCSAILPCPIRDAYLYGSYARGDHDAESDIDILLTADLDWPQIAVYRGAVSKLISGLSLAHDVTISVSINPSALFMRYADILPYYQNVIREGIRYAA